MSSNNDQTAPLWLLFGSQFVSVIGDTIGQRCARVVFNGSRRLFMFSMMLVTCLQMLIILGAIQLISPSTVTGGISKKIFVNETSVENVTSPITNITKLENVTILVKKSVDICSLPHHDPNYDPDACYAQGPLTLYKVFRDCPYIWLNGGMNILYYVAEASLYREPAGIVLLVISALASSFLINPFQHIFDVGSSKPLRPATIIFGIIGAVLCVIERNPEKNTNNGAASIFNANNTNNNNSNTTATAADSPNGLLHNNNNNNNMSTTELNTSNPNHHHHRASGNALYADENDYTGEEADNDDNNNNNNNKSCTAKCWSFSKASLRIFPMFSTLSVCYAMWFVLLRLFNEHCSLNEWGYNSVDQVTLPIFLLPLLAAWDCLRSNCGVCVDSEKSHNIHDHHRQENNNNNNLFREGESVGDNDSTINNDEEDNNNNNNNKDDTNVVDDADVGDANDDFEHELGSNFDQGHSNILKTSWTSVRRAAKNYGAGFIQLFFYRFFINTRAIGYTMIANQYDLAKSYLELTLIRVLLSWLSSLLCIFLFPKFIAATKKEALVFKDWVNLALKIAGSILVTVSLILMNEK